MQGSQRLARDLLAHLPSYTIMVMIMAISPSLNACSLFLVILAFFMFYNPFARANNYMYQSISLYTRNKKFTINQISPLPSSQSIYCSRDERGKYA
jgi:hypothetical protein